MPFPVVFLILSSVVAAPALTFEMFRRAQNRELDQIAVDNQRIETGRYQREIFNALAGANEEVRALETLHHVFHACARAPMTATQCAAQDRLFEIRTRALHDLAGARARAQWTAMPANRPYAGRAVLTSDRDPGIREAVCPVCALPIYWEASGKRISHSGAGDPQIRGRVEVEGDWQLRRADWNYRLIDE